MRQSPPQRLPWSVALDFIGARTATCFDLALSKPSGMADHEWRLIRVASPLFDATLTFTMAGKRET
jgi:hypothetical protein